MQFSTAFLALLSATSALAAPAPAEATSMMVKAPQWSLQGLNRKCDTGDKTCTWNFKVSTGTGTGTACKYVVKGTKATPKASRSNGGPVKCGDFTITSGWSGQFGEGNGFTTLSVVSTSKKQIVWPAYTDKQLAGGKTVKPDQAYAPAALPK
ncbi:hypothetical protein B0J13DRAFT_553687 [Dactylonectria estremocensis]|uniref:Small secreted protein n=1 Tax=Dactylonectria estremocensis TaxID=1079267 RepID=A0A9P9J3F7_9HYPO|nr:hypothetical protein B0J13DRAFT_553687 [Dactylonectria estremocensis]